VLGQQSAVRGAELDHQLLLAVVTHDSNIHGGVYLLLCSETPLPEKYRDHALTNSRNYKDMRECHIQPDWLLVYKVVQGMLILKLIRTGSHSDLF